MFKKLFLIALFFIFSNQSYAFYDENICVHSLLRLMPEKSTLIMLLASLLLFLLMRIFSVAVRKKSHKSKDWMAFIFIYSFAAINWNLVSISENSSFIFLMRDYRPYFRPLYNDLMMFFSVLYIYIVSVVSDMPIAKRVWINWKIKIFFIFILIFGHVVGYRIAYLGQCTEHYLDISPLLGYNITFIFISILISLRKRADTLLMIALSGTLYNLLLLVDHFASDIIKQRSFIEVNGGMYGSLDGGYFVAASLFAIYTLYFCLTLFFTRSVKKQ